VYGKWPFDAFNPASRARFAAHLATPPRGAWYGGSLPACALWETYLRHVRPNADGTVALSRARLRHARLAHVLTTRELRLIPLMPMLLHAMHGRGEAGTNVWSALTTGSDYGETHVAAAYLLQRAQQLGVTVDGFVWHSKQCATADRHPLVYLFLAPPATASDFAAGPDEVACYLDSDAGWVEIERALSQAGLQGIDTDALERDSARDGHPGADPD
jgi:hypothetical protein